MSREWVDDAKPAPRFGPDRRDKRWVMRCDVGLFGSQRCRTESEPSVEQPELESFVAEGWFIADKHGDICPKCLAAGIRTNAEPHRVMAASSAGVFHWPMWGLWLNDPSGKYGQHKPFFENAHTAAEAYESAIARYRVAGVTIDDSRAPFLANPARFVPSAAAAA